MSVINEMLRDLEKRRSPDDAMPVLQGLRPTPARPVAPQAPSKWLMLAPTLGVVVTMLLGFALLDRRMDERAAGQPAATPPLETAVALPQPEPAAPVVAVPEPAPVVAVEPAVTAPPAVAALPAANTVSPDPSALIMQEALALLSEIPEPAPLPAAEVGAGDAQEKPEALVRLLGARLAQTDVGTRLTFELSGQTTHSVERDDRGRLQLLLRNTRLTEAPPRLPLGGTVLRSVHVSGEERDVRIELEPVTGVHAQSTMLSDGGSARLVLVLEPSGDWAQTRSEAHPAAVEHVVVAEPLAPLSDTPALASGSASASAPASASASASASEKPGSFRKTPVELSGMQMAERSYRRALDLIAGGVEEIAVQALEEALAYEPAHVAAAATLAATLLRLGRPEEAMTRLQAARGAAGDQPAFAKTAARILIQQGKPTEALARLIQTPPALAEDPEYHAMIAALYQRGGDHARAAAVFKRLLSVRADRAAWWMGLGISLEGEGKPADALVAYRNAGQLGGLGTDSAAFTRERIATLSGGAG